MPRTCTISLLSPTFLSAQFAVTATWPFSFALPVLVTFHARTPPFCSPPAHHTVPRSTFVPHRLDGLFLSAPASLLLLPANAFGPAHGLFSCVHVPMFLPTYLPARTYFLDLLPLQFFLYLLTTTALYTRSSAGTITYLPATPTATFTTAVPARTAHHIYHFARSVFSCTLSLPHLPASPHSHTLHAPSICILHTAFFTHAPLFLHTTARSCHLFLSDLITYLLPPLLLPVYISCVLWSQTFPCPSSPTTPLLYHTCIHLFSLLHTTCTFLYSPTIPHTASHLHHYTWLPACTHLHYAPHTPPACLHALNHLVLILPHPHLGYYHLLVHCCTLPFYL